MKTWHAVVLGVFGWCVLVYVSFSVVEQKMHATAHCKWRNERDALETWKTAAADLIPESGLSHFIVCDKRRAIEYRVGSAGGMKEVSSFWAEGSGIKTWGEEGTKRDHRRTQTQEIERIPGAQVVSTVPANENSSVDRIVDVSYLDGGSRILFVVWAKDGSYVVRFTRATGEAEVLFTTSLHILKVTLSPSGRKLAYCDDGEWVPALGGARRHVGTRSIHVYDMDAGMNTTYRIPKGELAKDRLAWMTEDEVVYSADDRVWTLDVRSGKFKRGSRGVSFGIQREPLRVYRIIPGRKPVIEIRGQNTVRHVPMIDEIGSPRSHVRVLNDRFVIYSTRLWPRSAAPAFFRTSAGGVVPALVIADMESGRQGCVLVRSSMQAWDVH